MESQGGIFRPLLLRHPRVEPCLRRLCESITRREELRGTAALGRTQGRAEDFEPLLELFGRPALSLSSRGEIRLSLDAYFSAVPPQLHQAWLDELFATLELPRVNRPLLKKVAAAEVETLLERFRVAFPDLGPVYMTLGEKKARWVKVAVADGTEALQASWFQAAKIALFLIGNREVMTLADLGARLCGDSKALKAGNLPGMVAEWLGLLEGEAGMEKSDLLARYHVVENPGAIRATLFGPVVFWKQGRRFDFIHEFWRFGEAATLSWDNLNGVDRVEIHGDGSILSCENESPFRRLQSEKFSGVVVYTQGYPNAAVLRLWDLLGRARPDQEFLHWGDSDLAGLRIASILHRVRPLRLYRCQVEELERHRACMKPLTDDGKTAIARFLEDHRDFPFREELAFTREAGWLEQESWRA